jgi:hypothetical protein
MLPVGSRTVAWAPQQTELQWLNKELMRRHVIILGRPRWIPRDVNHLSVEVGTWARWVPKVP